ncbi:inosine monophosphate dehydrogenase [Lepidopterella palustris CBS 459.81]|uniref:Inosine monophosphate dehydrogenase n=1 Tax=Lepidopterella palustris CBS 459.81 TaxID=1314670 RepID=A0A8E2JCT5_9PEZI|nr:inosine monophosphate dehydrogenase [Lepidopterella palustris CBS 459.81]
MASPLQKSLPWTQSPLIISAPMGGFAGGDLASAVSNTGGLGMIGAVDDMAALRGHLTIASCKLHANNSLDCSVTLPIGVGLLPFISPLQDALAVLAEFQPAVVWLFAARDVEDYAVWATAIREVCKESGIWIQTGSVASALRIAEIASPDVLVMQGADAGGHGFEKSASIISLLPETLDALREAGFGKIPLVAAGGIADGRGVAAAMALGAEGVVLGTRFLASRECVVAPGYLDAVLRAMDGGLVTVRSKIFDELRGKSIWPRDYNGRAVAGGSWTDWAKGVKVEEVRRRHASAVQGEDAGFGVEGEARAVVWAGTGVGMVRAVEGAGDIVREVREGAVECRLRWKEPNFPVLRVSKRRQIGN